MTPLPDNLPSRILDGSPDALSARNTLLPNAQEGQRALPVTWVAVYSEHIGSEKRC